MTSAESTDSEPSLLEEEWPYEHVEPGEVTQDLSYQEAKTLRQELDSLRSTIDEWACDDCETRKSVCWRPATDTNLGRVCAGFEDPHEDTHNSEDTQP